jgi:hypothetical protein
VAAQRYRGPVAEAIAGDPPPHRLDQRAAGSPGTLGESRRRFDTAGNVYSISSMAFCALPAAAESSSSFLRGTKRAPSDAW